MLRLFNMELLPLESGVIQKDLQTHAYNMELSMEALHQKAKECRHAYSKETKRRYNENNLFCSEGGHKSFQ
jgi:hypothetical protein